MTAGRGSPVLLLAQLAVFWAVPTLHMLRIVAVDRLPDPDLATDAGHLVMGVGMTAMVLGLTSAITSVSVGVFAAVAVVFVVRCARAQRGHHISNAVIALGLSAMALMSAGSQYRPAPVAIAMSAALTICAIAQGRQLTRVGKQRSEQADTDWDRVLVVAPHASELVMTLAMAAMVAAG